MKAAARGEARRAARLGGPPRYFPDGGVSIAREVPLDGLAAARGPGPERSGGGEGKAP